MLFWIPNFWTSRFPDFQNLVRAWAGPGLSHLEQHMLIFYCRYWCLSSRQPVSSRRDESKYHQVLFFPHQHERRVPANLSRPLYQIHKNPSSQALFGEKTGPSRCSHQTSNTICRFPCFSCELFKPGSSQSTVAKTLRTLLVSLS